MKTLYIAIIFLSGLWYVTGITSVYAPCANDEISCGDIRPLPSPLHQVKLGTQPKDVLCHDGFTLVIKSENNSPACVHSSSMERMLRQGWWVWNEKVGDTIVNTPDKQPFDYKNCAIPETMYAIVGTNNFVLDDLPTNGTIFHGADTSRMTSGITQFAIHPGTSGQIILTYDFNTYPGGNCKVTTNDVISNEN